MTRPWIVQGEFPVTGLVAEAQTVGLVAKGEGVPWDVDARPYVKKPAMKICAACKAPNGCAKRGNCLHGGKGGQK